MQIAALVLPALVAGFLSGCSTNDASVDPRYGVKASPRVVQGGPVRKGGGRYQVGKPYKIAGKWYRPKENPNYRAVGKASWYGDAFHGRLTANGEVFDMKGLTAAHPTLPLPSYVRVTNRANGHAVVVRVNDRGPFHGGRVIDVSRKVAELLAFKKAGIADVKVEYVDKARMDGQDDWLVTTATVNGQRMSPRTLASLGFDERLLNQEPPSRAAIRLAAARPAPRPSDERPADGSTQNVVQQVAAWPAETLSGMPTALVESAFAAESTEVLVGAFSDVDNIQYVAGALSQFGQVALQPVAFGGQLLQHMTVRASDPKMAQAALDLAQSLGAADARIAYP